MTNEAIKELLEDVLKIEESMTKNYTEIVKEIDNEDTKKILNSIIKQEIKHVDNAKKMLEIIGE